MRALRSLVFALVACVTPKPTQPSEPKDIDARTMHLTRRALDDSSGAAIEGRIFDTFHKEPAVGATVIATRTRLPTGQPVESLPDRIATPPEDDEVVRISDENGKYSLDVRPGTFMVTLYYNNVVISVMNIEVVPGFATRVDLTVDRDNNVPGAPLRITRR
jgi:hypothetical protein